MIQETRITEELLLNNSYQKITAPSKDEAFVSPDKKVLLWRNTIIPSEWVVTVISEVDGVPNREIIFTGWLEELNGHFERLQVPTLQ